MGMIGAVMGFLFGGGRNALRETAEIFRENAEAGAERSAELQQQALRQLGAEFALPGKGWFDRFVDGLNRLPRPALAFGTLGLFVAAMTDPVWFAGRMQGVALVPEPLWWLLGVIVSFYFGARHQAKVQDLQRDLAATMARTPQVIRNIAALDSLAPDPEPETKTAPRTGAAPAPKDANRALEDWRRKRRAASGPAAEQPPV